MGVGLRAKRQMFIPGVCLNERSKYRKVSKWVGKGCCVIGPLSADGGTVGASCLCFECDSTFAQKGVEGQKTAGPSSAGFHAGGNLMCEAHSKALSSKV
jgi:hypothetical protein